MAFSSTCGARIIRALCVLLFVPFYFLLLVVPLCRLRRHLPQGTFSCHSGNSPCPLTGATYSHNLRNDSKSNKLSLSIASDVSTTSSFYGACACKNWVLASGRDAEPARQRGYLLPLQSFCNAYYSFYLYFVVGKLQTCGLRLKPALYDVKRCFL